MKSNIRDFSKEIPPENICSLCMIPDEDCKCTKYNCKCNLYVLECNWPECTCDKCLELNPLCECKNG